MASTAAAAHNRDHRPATIRKFERTVTDAQPQPGLFGALASADLDAIAQCGATRTYPKHAVILSEGDETRCFYVIRAGRVKIYVSDEHGREVTLNTQGAGEYFGELSLIDQAPRSASIMTLESTKLQSVSYADFQRCLITNPELASKLVHGLAQRVRDLTELVKNLALNDAYGRVARTLVKLAADRDGQLVIERQLTHQDLANRVGASREMVSKIMRELTIGQYIEIKDKKITIPRPLPRRW
ncbi:MAG: Crp/Fnr family transcriptional regulator [Gammaproteobacteria bacterium]